MHVMHLVSTLFRRRWLVYVLVAHNLKLRYRGSLIGFLWTFLNPLIFMGIYSLVFTTVFRYNIAKYPVFLLSGLLAWTWFSEAIATSTTSVISGGGFIKSSIFPSEILPAVTVATAMMNFVFALPLLFIFLAIFRVDMGWSLLALPVIMVVHFILALGIASIVATYNVFFRDLQYLVNHILLALFFLTPVLYDLGSIGGRYTAVLRLNPLATLISGYRSIFFYNQFPHWVNLGYLFLIALVLLSVGTWVFQNHKEVFAEYI
jgi:ABC-type polysaccharide/polyol phosphate export permease